jgi:diacylglycerol kinase family enzyme
VIDGILIEGVVGMALLVLSVVLAKRAFSVHLRLPTAPRPQRPVVVWNPKSGGGKALKHNLADEARKRGIEPIELKPGDDLVALVQDAVARGADGLMAAGGDGTQALVATIAAEHDLPFACIPAGTRNHFALDLGVDRDDVVGALEAFVDGGEKRVDLGEVGGRTFVNNVSLGLYAEAVQSDGYRDAKIRTILDTVPTVLSRDAAQASTQDLHWTDPDGRREDSAAVVLVSNNLYRLGRVMGSGTRPRMDAGVLGVTVIGAVVPGTRHRSVKSEWATTEFVIESEGDVPVGVDGEALGMPTPLVFRTRPGVLRVRIAPHHPGGSPSAAQPTGLSDALRRLVRIAGGADPADAASTAE